MSSVPVALCGDIQLAINLVAAGWSLVGQLGSRHLEQFHQK